MLAGVIHFLVGATGLVGVLLRFIGPVTIVPTILLIGIYMVTSVTKFAQVHWGISSMYVWSLKYVALFIYIYQNMKIIHPL